ncbi:MAG: alpha/beta hydrolase [Spirochaetales bacterium]|nr:alpha/beta hydrolase [Spirochaetales bacterium]
MTAHWTQNDVSVAGARLHYYRTGRGDKRPLVLVHGFSDNGLCWVQAARDLESEYDVIMPDMRGHGLSGRLRPGEDVDMAADLAELIRDLKLKRPVVCGHSMGAGASYGLAVRFPDLAGALILEDPPWWMPGRMPPPPDGREAENPMRQWASELPAHSLEDLLEEYGGDHPSWPEDLLHAMCESKKQLDQGMVDFLFERMNLPGADWMATIGRFTTPLLVLAGSPELGGIVTPEVVARIRELKPDATVVVVPGVGHLIRFDAFPAFMSAVRAFLERLPD